VIPDGGKHIFRKRKPSMFHDIKHRLPEAIALFLFRPRRRISTAADLSITMSRVLGQNTI
jgi:hypothetical protein